MFGIEQKKEVPKPFNPPKIKTKTEEMCEVEGCFDVKAPGQSHVCTKHVRSN